jgi:3,4-dihydroxy 2-butanone 4-phosphate synthase
VRGSRTGAETVTALLRPGLNTAIGELRVGGAIVVSSFDRTVLVACAATVSTTLMAQFVRDTSGFIAVALLESVCDTMMLPEALPSRRAVFDPAHGQCVAVDAVRGVSTGISAADRAHTARVLADPLSVAGDITRPGHVVPVRVAQGGAPMNLAALCLDLSARAVPRAPGAVIADLVSTFDTAGLADREEGSDYAARQGLPAVEV